jgi:DNA replication protein DnaC
LGYEPYLLEVTGRECEVRQQKRIETLLHKSKLPLKKSLTEFDLNRLPRKVVNQIQTLRSGSFLALQENVLVFGNPGSGKTHLVSALGQELVRNRHRGYFAHCNLLVQELLRAKQELRLTRWLKKLRWIRFSWTRDWGIIRDQGEPGDRAILRAVTRVNPEQASKVKW